MKIEFYGKNTVVELPWNRRGVIHIDFEQFVQRKIIKNTIKQIHTDR